MQGAERLGRALGEAATAEDAEDRALQRLMARLDNSEGSPAAAPSLPGVPMARNLEKESPPRHQDREPIRPREISAPLPPLPRSAAEDGSEGPSPLSQAGSQRPAAMGQPLPDRGPRPAVGAVKAASQASPAPPAAAAEPPDDPEDWSGELAGLDLQLRRLGWDRDQEASFLQRAFGHPSRSRLTTYADLKAYLGALEGLPPPPTPPAPRFRCGGETCWPRATSCSASWAGRPSRPASSWRGSSAPAAVNSSMTASCCSSTCCSRAR